MEEKHITLNLFKTMIKNGANNLFNNYKYVDSLNVFPVPDGDTGTNMNLTMKSGLEYVETLKNPSFRSYSNKFIHGTIMGARGNSGVILSQFFRGFFTIIKNTPNKEITIIEIAKAFSKGKDSSYLSVMKPIEGTILTVIKKISEFTNTLNFENYSLLTFFEEIVKIANTTTSETMKMLKILKDSKVVDSGAKGLALILEGFLEAIKGNIIKINENKEDVKNNLNVNLLDCTKGFGFCTELLINLTSDEEESMIRKALFELGGESILVAKSERLLKIHVHVTQPMKILEYGFTLGEVIKVKSDNMTMQVKKQNSSEEIKLKKRKIGIVSICTGLGVISTLYESGSHVVHEASKKVPTVDTFVQLSLSLNAKTVIIIPNDKNYILAAEQARKQIDNVKIKVLETSTILEGLAALVSFNEYESTRTNLRKMKKAIKNTKSLEFAISDKTIKNNNIKIQKGDVILLENRNVIAAGLSELNLLKDYIKKEKEKSSIEYINILFGKNFNKDLEAKIKDLIEKYRLAEKKYIYSEHPLYTLMIGFE